MPDNPTTTDTITAHFQANSRCRIKNPMEITNIVDFDVSFFIKPPSLKKCVNEGCNSAPATEHD